MRALKGLIVAVTATTLVLLLAGCAAGPDYRRPAVEMPVAWKVEAPFREGAPNDLADKGPWWVRFGDPQLDVLEQAALTGSPTLAAANARLTQARATLAATTAGLFPQIVLGARATRLEISTNRPLTNYGSPNFSTVQNDFLPALAASYEVDLAGRVRRTIEGARASAEQSAADLENVRLLLTAELATDYFSLRELDVELDVLLRSIEFQRRALELATARHDLGAASGLDVAQQQSLLDSTLTQVDVLRRQRDQFEHAIATLVGTPAPSFAIPAALSTSSLPAIPVGLPSDLLQRRPDVAAAERAMAAANARIGVARAAYYPAVDLRPFVPGVGWESNTLATLFDAPSRLWSFGVSATETLFDAGKTRANVRIATADYTAAVAAYRQTVLNAMEEVENGITGLTSLDRAATQADASVHSAQRAFDIASDRYKGGVDTYLDVITTEQTLLADQRQAVQIHGQQFLTTVYLIKALGGGWVGVPRTASRSD